ncbi:acyltransferase [Pseudomonas sp. ArH3a]|uniref:acyltransferase family protein n=1 Tax=Pseudomonas sp. ArH3a TaxID=2862945 RepID=UPI001F563E73|nr:acyltransferase [Pseudomonas sp. ArH3a]UNM20914.1 acyltransferase [Pseudomonas sp. ArH3a]
MIKPLTSLRFFAALAVYIDHLGTDTDTGGLGVVFFFILSGFIITYTYASKINSIDPISLASIYVKRIGRIFPVHLLTLLFALPLVFITDAPTTFMMGVSNALLMHSWFPSHSDFFSLNSVSWTLSVEWAFYLAFPFLIVLIKKLGFDKSAAAGLMLSGICFAILLTFSLWLYLDPARVGSSTWLIRVSPMNLFIFLIGTGIAFYVSKETRSRDFSVGFATVLEVAALVIIAAAYYWTIVDNAKARLPLDYVQIYLPAFAFCIYIFSVAKGWVSKLLSNSFLVHLGNLSFSMYMIHLLAIIYADRYLMPVIGANGVTANRVYLFVLIMIACEVVYRLVENPYRDYARQVASSLSARRKVAAKTA